MDHAAGGRPGIEDSDSQHRAVTLPSNWPELTLALALALLVAYFVADVVARLARQLLRAVIADPEVEALFVDRPRRIIRLVIFLPFFKMLMRDEAPGMRVRSPWFSDRVCGRKGWIRRAL